MALRTETRPEKAAHEHGEDEDKDDSKDGHLHG